MPASVFRQGGVNGSPLTIGPDPYSEPPLEATTCLVPPVLCFFLKPLITVLMRLFFFFLRGA